MLRKLVGYAAYMFGASTLSSLLTLGVTFLGMSTRPKEAFGDYALYILIYTTGQSLFVLGANASIQKYSAGDNDARIRFAKLAYLGFLILLAASFVAAASVWIFGRHETIAIGVLGVPWVVVFFWGRYIVRSTLEAKLEARMMVVASLANSIFQFCFLTFTDLRDALIYGDALALVVSGMIAMALIPAGVRASLRTILAIEVPRTFWRESIRFAVPLWWAGQVFQARGVLDRSVTRLMLGSRPLGAYQALITLWQFVAKPMEFFSQAALPGLASSTEEERDVLYREIVRVALLGFCVLSLAVAGGITFLFQGIDFIFGMLGRESPPLSVKYGEVPELMTWAVLAIPATAAEMVANQYAVVLNRQGVVFRAQVATVITFAAAIYPLVAWVGILGVVLAGNISMLANALTFVIGLWDIRTDSMRTTLNWTLSTTFLTALAVMPIFWMSDMRFPWLSMFPSVAIFCLGCILFRLIGMEDFRRVLRAVKERRIKPEPKTNG